MIMAEWKISNDLPYLDEFPVLYQITEYPNALWRQVNGELPYKTCFPEMFDISDAPVSMWRISDDIPYKLSFPDLFKFTDAPSCMWIICDDIPYKSQFPEMPSAPFITFKPVQQHPYICVYDVHTPMNEFEDNGLCILMPCKCEITEELNGSYDLTLEHPIDAEGRWRFLLEANIIKADGQLFRIYSKQTKLNSDGSRIRTVKARHIFYDLNDKLLMDVRPENRNGHDFLEWIFNRIYDDDPEHYYPVYNFSYDSDIVSTATAYYVGVSVTASLIGEDNCFINRLGGELYRDNFYFSINTQRESSRQNSFDIVYGMDMIEVEETIDYSDLITNLFASDNFGNKWEVFYENTPGIAHHVSRCVNFTYEEEDVTAFHQDVNNYFQEHCFPKVNYKVIFANLKNVDLYKDFINLKECNVGDTGNIYCEELDISTEQKIVKKTIDVMTGNTVSIELGNLSNSLTRRDKYAGTIETGDSASKAAKAAAKEAKAAFAASLKTWNDCLNYQWKKLLDLEWKAVYKEPETDVIITWKDCLAYTWQELSTMNWENTGKE